MLGIEINEPAVSIEMQEKAARDMWVKLHTLQPRFTTETIITATRIMAMESGKILEVIKWMNSDCSLYGEGETG